MGTIKRFEDIQAWQKARELVREIYKTCANGSLAKDFGLKDQLCRAAVSGMSNVAEGFAKKSDRDFAHYLDIAKGSVIEVQSVLYVAMDVGHISKTEFERLYEMANQVASLIGAFTSYLRNRSSKKSLDSRHRTVDSGHRTPDHNQRLQTPDNPSETPNPEQEGSCL